MTNDKKNKRALSTLNVFVFLPDKNTECWKRIFIFLIACCPLVSTFSKFFSSHVYLTSSYSLFLHVYLFVYFICKIMKQCSIKLNWILQLSGELSEASMVHIVLRHIHKLAVCYAAFPKLSKVFLKVTESESESLLSWYICTRKFVLWCTAECSLNTHAARERNAHTIRHTHSHTHTHTDTHTQTHTQTHTHRHTHSHTHTPHCIHIHLQIHTHTHTHTHITPYNTHTCLHVCTLHTQWEWREREITGGRGVL